MHEIKVGDKVRLTGPHWVDYEDSGVSLGDIVAVTEIDSDGIWAGDAGTVGNRNGLYSASNPEGSGDYSCELYTAKSFTETVSDFSSAVSPEDIESIARLGDALGIEEPEPPLAPWEKELLWTPFEQNVRRITDQIADLLIAKNKAYGDSALNPIRVFSKSDRIEQLNVRIDDKISRIQRGTDFEDEDTERDLIGYLILKLIAKESE